MSGYMIEVQTGRVDEWEDLLDGHSKVDNLMMWAFLTR